MVETIITTKEAIIWALGISIFSSFMGLMLVGYTMYMINLFIKGEYHIVIDREGANECEWEE